MRQMVLAVILAAAPVAAIAVLGMIVLGLHQGDGLATSIAGNLQTIALTIVVAMAGVVQHFMGAASASAQPPAQQQPMSVQNPTPSDPGGA